MYRSVEDYLLLLPTLTIRSSWNPRYLKELVILINYFWFFSSTLHTFSPICLLLNLVLEPAVEEDGTVHQVTAHLVCVFPFAFDPLDVFFQQQSASCSIIVEDSESRVLIVPHQRDEVRSVTRDDCADLVRRAVTSCRAGCCSAVKEFSNIYLPVSCHRAFIRYQERVNTVYG